MSTIVTETWSKYNAIGNLIWHKEGNEITEWIYNENGQLMSIVTNVGIRKDYTYDEYGALIHTVRTVDNQSCEEVFYEYDDRHREIYRKWVGMELDDILEVWMEYDENGNLVKEINSDGSIDYHEYDENDNEIHYWRTREDV